MPARYLRLLTAALLASLIAGVGSLSLQRKVEASQPLGFEARPAAGSWLVERVDIAEVGLRPGDRIILVAGEQVRDLSGALRGASSSQLTVLRGGAPLVVPYVLPPLDIDWTYLLLALLGAGYLLIGCYTLLRDQRRPARLFYLWCLTSAALYLVSPTGTFDAVDRTVYVADLLARLLVGPLTLHLFLAFPAPLALPRRLARAIPFLYLPAAALLALEVDLAFLGGRWLFGPASGASVRLLDHFELFHLIAFALLGVLVLAYRLRATHDPERQRQVAWIAVGLAGGYLPFLLFYALPEAAGLSWPEPLALLPVAPLAVVPVTFAYAILRYKLWDIEAMVRNTVTLALTALIGIFGFTLANAVVNRVVPEDFSLARNLLAFASGLLIAGVLIPTRRQLGASLERLQYGSGFLRRRALLEFGRQLVEERSLDRLCDSLLGQLESALDLERVNLYLMQDGTLAPVRPERGLPSGLFPAALGADLWEREMALLAGAALPQMEPTPMQRLHAAGYRYAFPLRVRETQVGVALAGYKRDGVPLSGDDSELIRNLLNQASLGIENARLLDRVQQQLGEVLRLQEFSQSIIESSPAGIAVVDQDERVVSCNLGFGAIVGIERPQLTGRALAEVLPVELPASGDGLQHVELRNAHGELRHLQISRAPFASGEVDHQVLIVQDISERVAMENALREGERLAALGMLAAGVAHEVNTPITGISSYAQMLLADTPEDDPRHELLKKMERQTFRAARIVNNLLDFARERASELRPVRVAAVIDECLHLFAERLAEGGVTVEWERPASDPQVLGNEGELQQVFTNLVANAIDAMGDRGGRLALTVESRGERVTVTVADDGPGIPAEELQMIFRPFYSTKLGRGGTGLGLAISHNIVTHHRGEIRVESVAGEGSRFIVELPCHRAPAERA